MTIWEQQMMTISGTMRLNKNETHIGSDGLLYCNVCGEKRQTIANGMKVPCICSCRIKEIEEQEEKERQAKKQRKLDRLFKQSLMSEKYKEVCFENTETTHSEEYARIYNRCRKYCDVADKVLAKGIGVYLYGESGNGKTRLTACMANELLKQGYTVIFTNFGEIGKRIKQTFVDKSETEFEFVNKLTSADFLFIDDFGTEQVMRSGQDVWLQEKVFDIVNQRYNKVKPMIFTSNYSMRELANMRGMAKKTLDRIGEVCEPMHLVCGSFRKQKAQERERLF